SVVCVAKLQYRRLAKLGTGAQGCGLDGNTHGGDAGKKSRELLGAIRGTLRQCNLARPFHVSSSKIPKNRDVSLSGETHVAPGQQRPGEKGCTSDSKRRSSWNQLKSMKWWGLGI